MNEVVKRLYVNTTMLAPMVRMVRKMNKVFI